MSVILGRTETSTTTRHGEAVEVEVVDIETLFAEHSRYVAAIGIRLLGRDSELEDLVQDVFLDALRGIKMLRDPGATRAWLATLTVRSARRRIRRRRLRRIFESRQAVDYSGLVDPQASPEERALLTRCYALLDTLPANHRLAWILRHIEGESLSEVAAHCECSLASAKRYIQRAQAHLQGALDHG